MISDPFLLRLAASFAAGFVVVASVTALADKSGEGPAGFIGGLPGSGPVSLLAIGFTQSTSAAVRAVTLFPLGVSTSMPFLLFYAIPRKMRFWSRMALASGLWAVLAIAVALFAPENFALSVGGGLVVSVIVLFARSMVQTEKASLTGSTAGVKRTILRGILGGTAVTIVVIIGALVGPLAGGVFAGAPVTWSSSLYVTSRSQGLEFSRSLTWTFMRTGALTIIPYAIAAYYVFPMFGIWLGTLLAYAAILPPAYAAWRLTVDSKTGR